MKRLFLSSVVAILAISAQTSVCAQPQQACYKDTALVDEVYGRKDTMWVVKPTYQKGDWNLYWDFALTKIKAEYHFNNGSEKIGVTKEYYKNGQLSAEWHHDGALNRFYPPGKEWYWNGSLKKERIQTTDSVLETSYHLNGKISAVNKWNRSGVWVLHREWCDNGQVILDYNPTSEAVMPIKKYHCNGNVSAEYNWYGYGYVGKYKEYYSNGKVAVDGQYTEKPANVAVYVARKSGTWTFYDDKGKVTKKEKWENGKLLSTE